MKSIATVIGSFLFSIFLEGFIRVIIIFYHQESFIFFGTSSLPGLSWVLIIIVSTTVISWICGMLTVTIVDVSPIRHLFALAFLLLFWRITEIIQTYTSEPIWYLIGITAATFLGLYLSFLTLKHTHASKISS
tara:strand:+ start:2591 stop:2989 length:399 start_codon:yes stop_codon:yes gene_type:complete